jgi:poly-gamma-glutamate synthesis protein (capsule biosynthesis protein)
VKTTASFFHFIFAIAVLTAGLQARAQEPVMKSEPRVRVVVGGDVLPHPRVKEAATRNGRSEEAYFGSLLESLKPVVERADFAFANLETPISTTQPRTLRPMLFNAPSEFLRGLKWTGFDILSVANNHSLDQKIVGLNETLQAVEAEGLIPVGAATNREQALNGYVANLSGVRVGFLAFTSFVNDNLETALASRSPYLALVDRKKDLYEAIASMRKKADVVLLSLHWGVEYETEPRSWQRRFAEELHERGVDVIVGHHPHVLQPIRWYDRKDGKKGLTIFSLGNLISNQSSGYEHRKTKMAEGNTRDGALVELHLSRAGVSAFRVYPLWTDNWKGEQDGIRTVRISEELRTLSTEIDRLKPSPQKTFLLERRTLLSDRFRIIYETLDLKVPEPVRRVTARP